MKNILITGGTGSVGQALVKLFSSKEDYRVTFSYHSNDNMAEYLSSQYKATAIRIDDPNNHCFNYDIIISNAGINISFAETENVKLEDWNKTIEVNLTFPFILFKKSLPFMKTNKWGRIVSISSIYGLQPEEDVLPFNVSKHGLIGLTKTVAKEYAKYGITANTICPGPIKSKIVDHIADIYSSNETEKNKYYSDMIEQIPAKRLAEPIEIAKLVMFLASDDASYINGATIVIDGSLTCL